MHKHRMTLTFQFGVLLFVFALLWGMLPVDFSASAQATPPAPIRSRARVNRGLLRNAVRITVGTPPPVGTPSIGASTQTEPFTLWGYYFRADCVLPDGTPDDSLSTFQPIVPYSYAVRDHNFELNLRATPSLYAPVVGVVSTNDPIFILDNSFCFDGYMWRSVLYRGRVAWALEYNRARRFINPQYTEPESPEQQVMVCLWDDLRTHQIIEYDFPFRSGERVSFNVSAYNYDTVLMLETPSGQSIELGTFTSDNADTRWETVRYQVPETGSFRLGVTTLQEVTYGTEFRISMLRFDSRMIEYPPDCIR